MSCRAPASLDVRRSTAMPALRGLVSGPWPLRAYLKRSFVNHQQPRTAFCIRQRPFVLGRGNASLC